MDVVKTLTKPSLDSNLGIAILMAMPVEHRVLLKKVVQQHLG